MFDKNIFGFLQCEKLHRKAMIVGMVLRKFKELFFHDIVAVYKAKVWYLEGSKSI